MKRLSSSFFKCMGSQYPALMTTASPDELVAILNELLEAERAGAKVTLETARQAEQPAIVQLMHHIQHDEARWCAMLLQQIRTLGQMSSELHHMLTSHEANITLANSTAAS
jgi:hypothetical protein